MSNKRIIDLSVCIDSRDIMPEKVTCQLLDHQQGAAKLGGAGSTRKVTDFIRRLLGRESTITHEDFPDKMGLSSMYYSLSTHTGTHIDAPYHYGWREDAQAVQKTITDIPLEWCYGRGIVIDCSEAADVIDESFVQQALFDQGREIGEGDIVLIHTGASERYGKPSYCEKYKSLTPGALSLILNRGVKVVGVDTFSFDAPFKGMLEAYRKSKDKSCLWPNHVLGRSREYIQIERLANLKELLAIPHFNICCFPIKLWRADAAWSRVVAIV